MRRRKIIVWIMFTLILAFNPLADTKVKSDRRVPCKVEKVKLQSQDSEVNCIEVRTSRMHLNIKGSVSSW